MLPNLSLSSSNPKTSFWISFSLTSIISLLAFICGGMIWRGDYPANVVAFTILVIIILPFMVFRTRQMRAGLIRTGLEWVFALLFLTSMFLWILSPAPRSGIDRIGWVLADLLLFYLLLEAYDAGLERFGVLYGLIASSGLVLIMAVLEVYGRYSLWWQQVGFGVPPPYPYRLVSIIGHSNALMGVLNLCAPLALVVLFAQQKIWMRILAIFWLVFYLVVLPFSSSRGGWMGFAAWLGVLICYWVWKKKVFQRLRASLGRRILWVALLVGVLLLGAAIAFIQLWTVFSAHPTHGTGILSSRIPIWSNALRIWQSNPIIGVGQGRFGLEYLRVDPSIPPNYWATHAHNLILQNAAEGGLLQALVLLVFMIVTGFWIWRKFLAARPDYQIWAAAILAAMFSWLVQNIVDDLSGWGAVMVPLIFLLVWLAVASGEPAQRWSNLNGQILWLPLILVAGGAAWNLWTSRPTSEGITYARQGQWPKAANRITQSVNRDPNFAFYSTQAGLAWAQAWEKDGNPLALLEARRYLKRSLSIEPTPSLFWADLAVLEWFSGNQSNALDNIEQAVQMSPAEASYPLILGWFQEETQQVDEARSAYEKSLTLNPEWVSHPFWRQTAFRSRVLDGWLKDHPPSVPTSPPYWKQAEEAFRKGDITEANRLLAYGEWVGEPGEAINSLRGQIFEKQGNFPAAIQSYEEVRRLVDQPNLRYANFAKTYATWLYSHDGIDPDLVPGYLQLSGDQGQFTALERLHALYIASGRCAEAEQVWTSLQRAIRGGSLEPTPISPACTPKTTS